MRNALIGIVVALALIVGAIVVTNITAASRAAKRGAYGAQEYIAAHKGEIKGDQGGPGAQGVPGVVGEPGLACWDSNEDGFPDLEEDRNGDGLVNVEDCQIGIQGKPGLACWDFNGNSVADPEEDLNGDKFVDLADCRVMDCRTSDCKGPAPIALKQPKKGGGKKGDGGKPQPDGGVVVPIKIAPVEQVVTVNINGEPAEMESDQDPSPMIGTVNGEHNNFYMTSVRVK